MAPEPETIRVVCAAIERDGAYLITQRRKSAIYPSLWEFPGGRAILGETDAQTLTRELQHRLGIAPTLRAQLSDTPHIYPSYTVQLALYLCTLAAESAQPEARQVQAIAWVRPDALENYPFAPADEQAVGAMLKLS